MIKYWVMIKILECTEGYWGAYESARVVAGVLGQIKIDNSVSPGLNFITFNFILLIQ